MSDITKALETAVESYCYKNCSEYVHKLGTDDIALVFIFNSGLGADVRVGRRLEVYSSLLEALSDNYISLISLILRPDPGEYWCVLITDFKVRCILSRARM